MTYYAISRGPKRSFGRSLLERPLSDGLYVPPLSTWTLATLYAVMHHLGRPVPFDPSRERHEIVAGVIMWRTQPRRSKRDEMVTVFAEAAFTAPMLAAIAAMPTLPVLLTDIPNPLEPRL